MFQIDAMSRVPVYEQIVKQAERFILKGILKAGDKMPSVRSLSIELSINPNTIQKAYNEMDHRGMVVSVPGKGVFISETARESLADMTKQKVFILKDLLQELRLAGIPRDEIDAWVDAVYESAPSQKGQDRELL